MNTRLYQERLRRIRTAATTATLAAWDRLPAYHEAQIEEFTQQAVPVVQTAQRLAVRSTFGHLRRPGLTPVRLTPALLDPRNGVSADEVYARPFGKVWKALGEGRPLDQAVGFGRSYLAALPAMDVALSVRATYEVIGQASDQITSWVRVADAGACDLCSSADGTVYRDAVDMGLHPACGCTLEPNSNDDSPSADPAAFTTHDSDELGALIYAPGHSFAAA